MGNLDQGMVCIHCGQNDPNDRCYKCECGLCHNCGVYDIPGRISCGVCEGIAEGLECKTEKEERGEKNEVIEKIEVIENIEKKKYKPPMTCIEICLDFFGILNNYPCDCGKCDICVKKN